MDLEYHYQDLYETSIKKIKADDYQIDTLIHDPTDKRFGITLLIRPSEEVKHNIQKFLKHLKTIDPNQYYYENSDIHITVMSIISCYNGFNLDQIDISKYIEVIKKSIIEQPLLEIEFKGVTASPSCIMLKGFMKNNSLNAIRDNLRIHFKNSSLEQSLDKRYTIQTAHTTVVRFCNPLNNKTAFLTAVESYKNYNFGTFKVDNLELVYNDWYQKEEHVKTLFNFSI